ncbi:type I glutamate--ammonia ligase [Bifidobacterium platyrrhinorum]|uniref:Glutamine synthetase n=1 Tax=Bifidobacterium platyrrhinorum TaxID=2661628 RepID=A0A6L9SQR8_9BIFI|nr:glutamine synthetase family protein [Bifidobacterium platyrrhinorum]NEG54917.1 glutamine synthetase [Bifidobacterium platyrrhinorum]
MTIQTAGANAAPTITTELAGGSSAAGPAPHSPELVQGTFVDLAGVTRAKNVPARRREVFAKNGLGAPKVWVVFNADNNFAENDTFNVTGDLRLRLDTAALRHLDEHIVWGPTNLANQDGTPSEYDPRTTLANVEARAEQAGYSAQFGFEFEFLLLPNEIANDRRPDIFARPWLGYGAQPFIEQDAFFADLTVAADAAGIELEQLHTEWGTRQYEVSVAPDTPVAAADKAVLFKLLVKRTAARHGLTAVFSPKPFPDQAGSGGHIHFSLTRLGNGEHLFSGGRGVYGLTAEGGHAIAGVQAHLAELTAILSGSPVSLLRLQPDTWSGAAIGWGLENREVAIRYAAATLGNPRGANIEIKTGDAAANPYLALAGLLSAALDGIEQSQPLFKPTEGIPASFSEEEKKERGLVPFPNDFDEITRLFGESKATRRWYGDGIVDAIVAIRGLVKATYGDTSDEDLTTLFRHVW